MDNYSVLMTVYKKDVPEYFKISVESMLNQSILTNDFVLICDGPLTDELNILIDFYEKKYSTFFNVFRLSNNVGLGSALAYGVLKCKNELIARMDDDDISHVDRCKKQLEFMQNNNIDIVSSYVNEFINDSNKKIRVKKVPIIHEDILKFSKRRNPFNHSAVMIKKSALLSVGNYSNMRTNQDVDTWIRMLNNGCKGANIPESLVDFRFNSDTYKRRKDWKNIKLLIEVWKNFYENNYCSLYDYVYVIVVQIVIFLAPKKILKCIYNIFR